MTHLFHKVNRNEAIGVAICGSQIYLAHLQHEKGRIRIKNLDNAQFKLSLDYWKLEDQSGAFGEQENKDVFGIKEDWQERKAGEEKDSAYSANIEILYKLLYKHVTRKTRIAFNIPLSTANYQPIYEASNGKKKSALFSEKPQPNEAQENLNLDHRVIEASENHRFSLTFEQQPTILSILGEVNEFLGGKLYLGLMDTPELALVNLAALRKRTAQSEFTAILYVEDNFSRIIFLRRAGCFISAPLFSKTPLRPIFCRS